MMDYRLQSVDALIVTMIIHSAGTARLPTRPDMLYFPDMYR